MAITIASRKRTALVNKRMVTGTLTMDTSYATGGLAFTSRDMGLLRVEHIQIDPVGGFSFEYDYTNSKIKALVPSVVVGAAGAATVDDFPLTGTGASTARSISLDNAAGSSTVRLGPSQEVAATTNLSTVVTRYRAIGI